MLTEQVGEPKNEIDGAAEMKTGSKPVENTLADGVRERDAFPIAFRIAEEIKAKSIEFQNSVHEMAIALEGSFNTVSNFGDIVESFRRLDKIKQSIRPLTSKFQQLEADFNGGDAIKQEIRSVFSGTVKEETLQDILGEWLNVIHKETTWSIAAARRNFQDLEGLEQKIEPIKTFLQKRARDLIAAKAAEFENVSAEHDKRIKLAEQEAAAQIQELEGKKSFFNKGKIEAQIAEIKNTTTKNIAALRSKKIEDMNTIRLELNTWKADAPYGLNLDVFREYFTRMESVV